MENGYTAALRRFSAMDPAELLLHWMTERHKIYKARTENKPRWEWTKDPVLNDYRFCNVYRELDKVTVWIRENWREPYADHPNLWFAMAVARQINLPETLQAIGFPEKWNIATAEKTKQLMTSRLAAKQKVYNGAYILGIIGHKAKGKSKPEITVDFILKELWDNRDIWKKDNAFPTLESACAWFTQFSGFAGFMSYEVVSDLRWTRYLRSAPDILTWANPGPGAKRGLNRLHGRPVDDGLNTKEALKEMRALHEDVVRYRDRTVLSLPIEMREIEHSLCEVDKYLRAYTALSKNENVSLDKFTTVPSRRKLV